ncbi:hypothetical protein BDY17DRAFT_202186 [Neohortaea acidophila]|uniref:Uncharacterized protein n=1 Tax=Neohortaea acidophila TaxID=245834 RepID=A0A6A6PLE7_9PEZI|nr:uncharacterized protein BDY17DRAFT_202186 [Neohortaea acidophila]KAF2480900.1 hypothetical protein BDY17DRAFT_202186 [Neohortaea acidophila]
MSFEFVHVTSERPLLDRAASTRVKTQVMRNFHQAQGRERRDGTFGTTLRTAGSSLITEDQSAPAAVCPVASHGAWVSNTELARMAQTVQAHRRWLESYRNSQDAGPTVANAAWRSSNSLLVLYAQCLEAIGLSESLGQSRIFWTEEQKTRIKVGLLQLLIDRLGDPDTAFEDETVAAIVCLASYELYTASSEVIMHLRGVSESLRLQTPPHRFQCPSVPVLMEIVDLLHALAIGNSTLYTDGLAMRGVASPASLSTDPRAAEDAVVHVRM